VGWLEADIGVDEQQMRGGWVGQELGDEGVSGAGDKGVAGQGFDGDAGAAGEICPCRAERNS
jgi:hypothetical protein